MTKRKIFGLFLTICFSFHISLADETVFSLSEKMDQNKKEIMQKYQLSSDKEFFNFKNTLLKKYTNQLEQPTTILLFTGVGHYKQTQALSCEANTAKDFINFYGKQNGENLVHEKEIIDKLPTDQRKIWKGIGKYKNKFYRADPDKVFVGRINGKQSKYRGKFTGYGIHPKGIKPVIQEYLNKYTIKITESTFDEQKIINSLKNGHPVMVWYISTQKDPSDPNHTKFTRYTSNNKKIEGYIGEHTALIVGADIDEKNQIKKVYYYEGLKYLLQTKESEKIIPLMKLQDKMLVVENQEVVFK